MSTTIYLVRHGAYDKATGSLNFLGVMQLAKSYREFIFGDEIDKIFVSPRQRATEGGQLVAEFQSLDSGESLLETTTVRGLAMPSDDQFDALEQVGRAFYAGDKEAMNRPIEVWFNRDPLFVQAGVSMLSAIREIVEIVGSGSAIVVGHGKVLEMVLPKATREQFAPLATGGVIKLEVELDRGEVSFTEIHFLSQEPIPEPITEGAAG